MIISTVTDSAVLILPIPAVISLQMPFKQKVKVRSMLGIGGIATGASFVRMVIVIRLQKSQDQTVDFVRFNLLGGFDWPYLCLSPRNKYPLLSPLPRVGHLAHLRYNTKPALHIIFAKGETPEIP
ncbi:hypothetical protein DM02DRAFT_655676 [Periconia macrospinosa]|uniref:Rhodopsin domain-containing protein n=1 Tax=Periconia macrospinosa TaxID=97972 RepID=A0A2V1DQG9_9PLEO|nr:hypothetical protein DM02DRAFT_655676 [Periconia macrospinosa]